MFDIIIIGAGPAGIFGTYYANFNGLKVLLLESDEMIGGKPMKLFPIKPVNSFPGIIDVTGEQFINNLMQQLKTIKNKNLHKIKTNVNVVDIKKENDIFFVTDQNKNVYQSKFIILSTGYASFKYRTIEQNKVKTKKVFNHYVTDLKKYRNKNVVILGGGDSAVDNALLLSSVSKKIYLIHHSSNFSAHKNSFHNLLANKKIKVMADFEVQKIEDEKVYIYNNSNKKSIKSLAYNELLICYGVDLIQNSLSKINIFNKIFKLEVDHNLESTKIKGLFGVGNITNLSNKDLILLSIADITKVVLFILEKLNKKITYY